MHKANAPRLWIVPHPFSGPSMIPYNSEPNPIIDSNAPTGSSGTSCSSLDDGQMMVTITRAAKAIGTETKNTEPNQKWVSTRPPSSVPMTPPAPANPAHTAIAFGRSCGGKTLVSSDSVDGMMKAAPTPIRQRKSNSTFGLPAWLDSTAALPKIARPTCSAPLRPNLSPSAPAGRSSPAKTTA